MLICYSKSGPFYGACTLVSRITEFSARTLQPPALWPRLPSEPARGPLVPINLPAPTVRKPTSDSSFRPSTAVRLKWCCCIDCCAFLPLPSSALRRQGRAAQVPPPVDYLPALPVKGARTWKRRSGSNPSGIVVARMGVMQGILCWMRCLMSKGRSGCVDVARRCAGCALSTGCCEHGAFIDRGLCRGV